MTWSFTSQYCNILNTMKTLIHGDGFSACLHLNIDNNVHVLLELEKEKKRAHWQLTSSNISQQLTILYKYHPSLRSNGINPSVVGGFVPILPMSRAVISADGKKNCLEYQCQKRASFLPSQLLPFPSIVLTALENDAAKGKTCETTEYKLSKSKIASTVHTLSRPSGGGPLYLWHVRCTTDHGGFKEGRSCFLSSVDNIEQLKLDNQQCRQSLSGKVAVWKRWLFVKVRHLWTLQKETAKAKTS